MSNQSGTIRDTSRKEKYQQHLAVVHETAAQYWEQAASQAGDAFNAIEIIKYTGGKMAGFFPAYAGFPPVFFKVYFYERGFQFEVEGLTAANAMPPVPGMRVPVVVIIFPEKKAVLTEMHIWEDTTSPLKRFFVQSLNIDWRRIGFWLRNFHDSKVSHTRNDYFLRKKFEKTASHMESLKPLFTVEQYRKMDIIIETAREHFSTQPCEWVISHGDFGLDNIKKSGDSLDIVDFEDCQMAPREFDQINFLSRLEYSGYFPHRQENYRKICREFLDGYGLELPVTPTYNFFYLLIKLDMLESYHRRRKGKSSGFLNQARYSYFEYLGKNRLNFFLEGVG